MTPYWVDLYFTEAPKFYQDQWPMTDWFKEMYLKMSPKFSHVCLAFSVSRKSTPLNSFPPEQNGHHFTDNIFKCIPWMKSFILIQIRLKFVPRGPIDKAVFVQVMVPNRRQAIICTNAEPVHWCIYVALGGNEVSDIISNSYPLTLGTYHSCQYKGLYNIYIHIYTYIYIYSWQ